MQSGKDYKEMSDLIKVSLETGTELFKNDLGEVVDRTTEQGGGEHKMNFRENPHVNMFYKPRNEEDELHVPDCDDFVVFYVKKSKVLKANRLF